jgi:hypothetical protein
MSPTPKSKPAKLLAMNQNNSRSNYPGFFDRSMFTYYRRILSSLVILLFLSVSVRAQGKFELQAEAGGLTYNEEATTLYNRTEYVFSIDDKSPTGGVLLRYYAFRRLFIETGASFSKGKIRLRVTEFGEQDFANESRMLIPIRIGIQAPVPDSRLFVGAAAGVALEQSKGAESLYIRNLRSGGETREARSGCPTPY